MTKEDDFLTRASNVYRTSEYIVRQCITVHSDEIFGTFLYSVDTFFRRTPKRDRQYEAAFEDLFYKDGSRVKTKMHTRKYVN